MAKKQEELTPQQEYDQMWERILNDDAYACAISKICRTDFFSYIVTMYYLINCNKFMLKGFHEIVIQKLQDLVDGKNAKRNLALCLPVGCLTGDTLIRAKVVDGGLVFEDSFSLAILATNRHFSDIQVYSLDDNNNLIWQKAKVVETGIKTVYEISFVNGHIPIKATATHGFKMADGSFKELRELKEGDELFDVFGDTDSHYLTIKSIKELEEKQKTYDIMCPDFHNYMANGLIVHNSGKSLITEYFISWCFARSRDNAFVYTSHSEDLITKMSAEIRNICTSPQWVRLFSWRLKKDDRQKTNFSFEGAKNRTGLRAKAINSAITGLDAGQPAVDGFSGALLIDDAMDAGNAIFEVERENVIRIYNEKLATRRRTSTTPTILIMQRLHPEDLVGWAERNQPELWDIVKVPALDENGNSFWEERYPAEELKMLQKKQPSLFQAQYQQDPIVSGGTIIHTDWFKYYDVHPKYDRIFIVADTAQKANEWNDYSVFQVWGKYANSLYMIDSIRGKWEIPELLQKAQSLTQKYRIWQNYRVLSALYIEDKGSGTGLIQQLRKACPTPILALRPKKKDKVTRMKDIVYYIESGYVYLPNDKNYGFIPAFLAECEMFSADGSAKHDDQCFVGDTLVATLRGDIPIRNVMEGDYVLTPFGAKRVLKAGKVGYDTTIKKFGLEATKDHKIFNKTQNKFDEIQNMKYDVMVDRLSYKGLLLWKYKKLKSSMELNIDLWEGRKSIILANQQQIKEEKVLKDCMLQFGNFIVDKKFLRALLFIIKTMIILITTSITWSVYLLKNTIKYMKKTDENMEKHLKQSNILMKSEKKQKNGIKAKKAENGIKNILNKLWQKEEKQEFAQNVEQNFKHVAKELFAKDVKTDCTQENGENYMLKPVYNLTVDEVGCFYANGILVSNCDCLAYAIEKGLAGEGSSIFD